MKISIDDWMNFTRKLSKLNAEASELVQDYAVENGLDDPELLDYAYGVVLRYGEASAALSAEMYDEIARLEGKILPDAEVAETPTKNEVAKAVNGTKKTGNPKNVGNAVGRLVKRTGADTMLKNAARDGAQFAWIPSGDTCPFCLMLASNGWQYMSKKALKNGHAEHIHANCDCTYCIRFDKNFQVEGYDPDKYLEMYYAADGATIEEKANSIRRQMYVQNKDKINAQKRAAYAEASLRTKGGGTYGVDWKIVKSKEYTNSFNEISDNTDANELAAQRARNILVHRNGKKTEEIYAISLTTGKDVSKIIDQEIEFGIERTEKFDSDIKRAIDQGDKILFIHNHPRGYPPSVVDINELLSTPDALGITIGHDGSIYLYSAPSRKIEESDVLIASRKQKWYTDEEKTNQELVLEKLQKEFGFQFRKIR